MTFDAAILDGNANWCLSGGADGSDLQWGMTAGKAGHGVIHWGFKGHKSSAPKSEIVILPQSELDTADPHCAKANETLKRRWPPQWKNVGNLLRRNWFQVCFSESCYAVSTLKHVIPGASIPIGAEALNAIVQGGTGWAVQMFIDLHDGNACPCYVFDQDAGYWFEWKGVWVRIYEPPKPQGIWAGIGTRKIEFAGKLAIRTLMDYKPESNLK